MKLWLLILKQKIKFWDYFLDNYRIGRILAPPIFSKKRGEGAKLSHKILSNLIKENNQSISNLKSSYIRDNNLTNNFIKILIFFNIN